jgi:hypothetical protein
MLLIPGAGDHEIVRSGQFDTSIRLRFVKHDLRMGDVDDTVAHQSVIDVVEAHRAKVVTAHATELKAIAIVLGHSHILEPFGGLPNTSEKGTLLVLLFLGPLGLRCRRVRVCVLRHCAQEADIHESERDDRIFTLPRELTRFPGKSENLRCIHWDCLLFVKSTLIFCWAIGDGFPETHLAGIRSVEPLVVTLGEIRESRLEMLSLVLQMESNKRQDGK